jgi:hypothetical protein
LGQGRRWTGETNHWGRGTTFYALKSEIKATLEITDSEKDIAQYDPGTCKQKEKMNLG